MIFNQFNIQQMKKYYFFLILLSLTSILKGQSDSFPLKDSLLLTNNKRIEIKTDSLLSLNLEKEIISLISEAKEYVKQQNQPKNNWTKILDFLKQIFALISTILTLIIGYYGLRKTSFFEKNKGLLMSILTFIFCVALVYIFNEILFTVVFAFLSVGVLVFVFFGVLLGYLKYFDDDKRVKETILSYINFIPLGNSKNSETQVEQFSTDFIESLLSYLNTIKLHQLHNKEFEMVLPGSLIADSDFTIFKLIPTEKNYPHWKNIDNKLLLPIYIDVLFVKKSDVKQDIVIYKLKNIQYGLVVVENSVSNLEYKAFDTTKWKDMATSFHVKLQDKMNDIWKDWENANNEISKMTAGFF